VSEGLCRLVLPDIAQERTSVALRLPRTADAALAFETPVGGSVRGWGPSGSPSVTVALIVSVRAVGHVW